MNEADARDTARIIRKISSFFHIDSESEIAIRDSLKYPRSYRSQSVCRHLKILLIRIKELQPLDVHKPFWRIINGLLKQSIDVLSGKITVVISRKRLPAVSKSLQKKESNKDIRTVLKVSDLNCPVPFWFAIPEMFHPSTKKLAEGSFAEIYEIKKADGEKRIVKIVAVGDFAPRSQAVQLTFKEISGEICASLALSKLASGVEYRCPSFPDIYRVSVVQDAFPRAAAAAWRAYKLKEKTDHPCPDNYSTDQAFIVIETESAGTDMDTLKIRSYLKALSVFRQIAAGLAVAEEKLSFEHRDLHPGNILLKKCGFEEKIEVRIGGERYKIETYGLKVTIIDFTYSRLQTEDGVKYLKLDAMYDPLPNARKGFLDHRFIYGKMGEHTRHRWSKFCPATNILWLQHIVATLLEKVAKERKIKTLGVYERGAMVALMIYMRTCLLYQSAAALVREIVFI